MADLKQTFTIKALNEYMQRSSTAMKASIRRNNVGITGEGEQSIAYQVAASGDGAVGRLSFKEYLRMVDMGAGRGHPLGGLRTMTVTLQASKKRGEAYVKDNVRKAKSIYAKPVYGNLGWLYNKLLYGYTEQTIAEMKKELSGEEI